MMALKRLLTPGLKDFFWRTRGIWIASPMVSLLVILLRLSGSLQGWEWRAYDLVMRSRPPLPQDSRIVIVGIDEKDVAGLKTSIFSDQLLADLLTKLKAMQPKAIGLDIYRDVPVPPGEAALAKIFQSTPNLIGIQKVAGQSGIDTVAPAPLLKARNQIAANDLPVDADNVIRRGFVYLSNGQETFYSFAFYLALIYLDSVGVVAEDIPRTDHFRLNQALFQPLDSHAGSYIRADAGGFQLLINYKGGKNSFPQVSMTDILQQRVPQDWGKDRIILIGKVGESFKDSYFTPYSNVAGLAQPMPGVEIHANIISSILSAALESRPLLRGWPEGLEWLWIMAWSTLGAILSWQFRYRPKQKRTTYFRWGSISLSLVALVGISYGALLLGWWIPLVPAVLGFLGSSVLITTLMARAGAKIRQTFGRYLTDQVVANLLEHPEGLQLGGDRRRITLLTSDLRGFTATSERLSPEEVIKILNLYLGAMAEVITHYQGTIDEFMGDGILVLFGAPTAQADDALRAVACAVAMQQALGPVNQQIMAWGLQPLEMGIGINTGEVVVGNIGSEKRTKYGVVGSQVNLTYRIESYTTGGQVLISESTLLEAGAAVQINGKRAVKPKGVKNEIVICDVGGVAAPYDLYLTSEEDVYVPIPIPLALSYAHLDGKHLDDTIMQAQLVQLSRKGGQIQRLNPASSSPSPLTNIKLNFQPIPGQSADLTGDIYAKVIETPHHDPDYFYVYFSAKPPEIETYLNHLYETLEKAPSVSQGVNH